MTPEQLAEVEALVAALPDSPWFLADCEGDLQLWLENALLNVDRNEDGEITGYRLPASYLSVALIAEWDLNTWDPGEDVDDDQRRAYGRFMAAARTAVPELLADVKRLQAELKQAKAKIDAAWRVDVWTNADEKKFVYVDDLMPALLGTETGEGR